MKNILGVVINWLTILTMPLWTLPAALVVITIAIRRGETEICEAFATGKIYAWDIK